MSARRKTITETQKQAALAKVVALHSELQMMQKGGDELEKELSPAIETMVQAYGKGPFFMTIGKTDDDSGQRYVVQFKRGAGALWTMTAINMADCTEPEDMTEIASDWQIVQAAGQDIEAKEVELTEAIEPIVDSFPGARTPHMFTAPDGKRSLYFFRKIGERFTVFITPVP